MNLKHKAFIPIATMLCLFAGPLAAQETIPQINTNSPDYKLASYNLTLEEVLHLAATQSNEAIRARNTFQVSYWEYRSYKANYLPKLSFTSELPEFSRQIIDVTSIDPVTGEVRHDYSSDFYNQFSGGLTLMQNLPTGGSVSVIRLSDGQTASAVISATTKAPNTSPLP
jgi:hypothetical protein